MRKPSLGEVRQLAQQQTASTRWAWKSYLAVCPQNPPPHRLSEIVITWEDLGVVGCGGSSWTTSSSSSHTVSCLLWSISLNTGSSESVLPSGSEIYDEVSCLLPLEASASAPGSGSPSAAGVTAHPVFSMGHACVTLRWAGVLWVLYQCGLVWNWRSHPFHHIVHESADAGDTEVQPQAAFSCPECNLKNVFVGPPAWGLGINQVPSPT